MKIVVKIHGGLGNQLFQYAMALQLSKILKTPIFIDSSWFSNISGTDTVRTLLLDKVGIKTIEWSKFEKVFLKIIKHRYFQYYFSNSIFYYLTERNLDLSNLGHLYRTSIYVDGYWQKKYLENDCLVDLRNRIKESNYDGPYKNYLESMDKSKLVAVHVRRGDYISTEKNREIYYVCDAEYYQASMSHIALSIESPHFLVFSDDIEWARNNIKTDHQCTFVEHFGDADGISDFRLMLNCSHFVIANSTFSWWASMLSFQTTGRIVVAPRVWSKQDPSVAENLLQKDWILF